MSTLAELEAIGVTHVRLPFWNPYAYLVLRPTGPWVDLFDVNSGISGGEPLLMFRSECNSDDWEPAEVQP